MGALQLCYLSAGDLSRLIKAKEISPVEVVDAHLDRIGNTDGILNSFLTLLPEQAKAAARRAENDIQGGNYRGPLHGIPVGLKDLFNTAGVRTTSGSRIFDSFIPEHDCTVAARFLRAGAILLGKLNMHPFAYGPTGENEDYGHMHNPWNPEMITGGSSGGSGSATAAGQCTMSVMPRLTRGFRRCFFFSFCSLRKPVFSSTTTKSACNGASALTQRSNR